MKRYAKYLQGDYSPINGEKYVGKCPIHYRSSWEFKMCVYLDRTPSVKKWGIESAIVPYFDPVTKRPKRYVIDFTAVIEDRTGSTKKYYIEIKPFKETIKPEKGRKADKKFLIEALTYARNSAKWEAASKFAKSKDSHFIILTEKELQI